MSNQQLTENALLKLILTTIEPWSASEITKMVQNMIVPKLEFITPLIKSPLVIRALQIGFNKHENEINMFYLDKGLSIYRKDLVPILNTQKGILWKRTMLIQIRKWGKTL